MPSFRGTARQGQLLINVVILKDSETLNPQNLQNSEYIKKHAFTALVDTGATNTAITKKVSQSLGLLSKGKKEIQTASASHPVNTYQVSVSIPIREIGEVIQDEKTQLINTGIVHIKSHNLEVLELTHQPKEFDIILGMDVISQGILIVDGQNFIFSY